MTMNLITMFILILALAAAFALGYASSAANQLEVRRRHAEEEARRMRDRVDSDRRDFQRSLERFEERASAQMARHIGDFHTVTREEDAQ